MHTYRRIDHEPDRYAELIWNYEEQLPQWFVDASHSWTPDFAAYLEFWFKCKEIWGLFDDDQLISAVYLQFIDANSVNIHVSVVAECTEEQIVQFFESLTRLKTSQGVFSKSAWILKKNSFLVSIAKKCGYRPNGLVMDHGHSRGKMFKWIEVRH